MPIDFTKPATTDNYATQFVPNIQNNMIALARMLDSANETIAGTPPTFTKRYNRTTTGMQEWNGTAWVDIAFQGLTLSGSSVGIGVSPSERLHVLNGNIRVEQTGAANVGLNILRSGGTVSDWFIYSPSGTSTLSFFGGGSDRMRLDTAGRVAIGGTIEGFFDGALNVQGRIHQRTTSAADAMYLWSQVTTGTCNYIVFGTGATPGTFSNRGTIAFDIGSNTLGFTSSGAMSFSASGVEGMRLAADRKFFVGASSDYVTPSKVLIVNEDSSTSNFSSLNIHRSNTAAGITNAIRMSIGEASSATGIIAVAGSAAANPTIRNTFTVGTQNAFSLGFMTNDVLRATFNSAGDFSVFRNAFVAGELNLQRQDTANEGGQLNICRASDNTVSWAVDVVGSGAATTFRVVNSQTVSEALTISQTGRLNIQGAAFVNAFGASSREVGYRDTPRVTAWERGCIFAASAGQTISASQPGETYSIYNDSAAAITLTQGSGVTLRQAGTANTGNRTLAPRGLATVWFNTSTEAVISGAGLS